MKKKIISYVLIAVMFMQVMVMFSGCKKSNNEETLPNEPLDVNISYYTGNWICKVGDNSELSFTIANLEDDSYSYSLQYYPVLGESYSENVSGEWENTKNIYAANANNSNAIAVYTIKDFSFNSDEESITFTINLSYVVNESKSDNKIPDGTYTFKRLESFI